MVNFGFGDENGKSYEYLMMNVHKTRYLQHLKKKNTVHLAYKYVCSDTIQDRREENGSQNRTFELALYY